MPHQIACPHCGDVTEQEFLVEWFTCGACDNVFHGARTSAPLSDGACITYPTPLAPKHDEGASTAQKIRWGVMAVPSGLNRFGYEPAMDLRRALDAGWEPFAVGDGHVWLRKWERADA